MPRTYTLRKVGGTDQPEEFRRENESLIFEQETDSYQKYLYRKKHKETIERVVDNQSTLDIIEYYTTTPIYFFPENHTFLVKSGKNYTDSITSHLKQVLGLTFSKIEFNFVDLFIVLETVNKIDFQPISIEIYGYVKTDEMFGNLSANISSKILLKELIEGHQTGIKSVRINMLNGFEADFRDDFTFKMYGNSRDDQEFFSLLNELTRSGGN